MRVKYPRKVMIQTNSLCNSDCIMCPYKKTSQTQSMGRMDDELFKKIIMECSENQVEHILLYLMNEPLMDKKIIEKIHFVKKIMPQVMLHIVSNGNLLTKELSEQIINSPLDYIEFSVHGITEKSYESIMKGLKLQDTLRNITEFVQLAKNHHKHEDYINIKLINIDNKINEKEKDDAIHYWQNLGLKRINFFHAPISRAGNVDWLKKPIKEKVRGCNSIWRNEMIHILYNGQIILCCMDWSREQILGNVKHETISNIWNSEQYLTIEKMIKGEIDSPKDFICKRCEESV